MNSFINHINTKNPAFKCYNCDDELEKLDFTAHIHHLLQKPALENYIRDLQTLIPENNSEIIDFYKIHNGVTLYLQTDMNKSIKKEETNSGILLYPIQDLENRNNEWKSYLLEDLETENNMFDYQIYGTSFGEISHTSNSFVLYDGKVFYDDLGEAIDEPIAESFFEFLNLIAENPAQFLEKRGGFTRFTDGKTKTQWIPKVFVNK